MIRPWAAQGLGLNLSTDHSHSETPEFSPLGLILSDCQFWGKAQCNTSHTCLEPVSSFPFYLLSQNDLLQLTVPYPPLQCDCHPYSFLRLHPYSTHPYIVSEGKTCLRASLFPVVSTCKPLPHLHFRVDFPLFSVGQFWDDAGNCRRKWRKKSKDEAKNIQSPCMLSVMAPDSCLHSCHINTTTATTAAITEPASASAVAMTTNTFTNTTVAAINNPTTCAATICYYNFTAILVTATTTVSAS